MKNKIYNQFQLKNKIKINQAFYRRNQDGKKQKKLRIEMHKSYSNITCMHIWFQERENKKKNN